MELPVASFRSLVVRTGTRFAEFVAPSGHASVTQVGPYHTFPGTATTDDYDCIVLWGQETSSLSPGETTPTAPTDLGDAASASVEFHKSFYRHP